MEEIAPHLFASSSYEELRELRQPDRARTIRYEHGQSLTKSVSGGWNIEATDGISASLSFPLTTDEQSWLRAAAECQVAELPRAPFTLRIQHQRRLVVAEARHRSEWTVASVRSMQSKLSMVVSITEIAEAVAALEQLESDPPDNPPADAARLALHFSRGSGAVLFHEAVGHPAESGAAAIEWPEWLSVIDDPSLSDFSDALVDDVGQPHRRANLLVEPPRAIRRSSFRDAPYRRMSNVLVEAAKVVEPPSDRIEIVLVEGGHYDAMRDLISLRVTAAYRHEGGRRRRIAPFPLRFTRAEIARRLLGGFGAPQRYPGVICSLHGQELPVGSVARDIVLERAD